MTITHIITILKSNGTREVHEYTSKPQLKELQRIVGGLIQLVPHWSKFDGRRADVWCNEEGRLNGLPFNEQATNMWLQVLGDGPFSYPPQLFGDIAVAQTAPKK